MTIDQGDRQATLPPPVAPAESDGAGASPTPRARREGDDGGVSPEGPELQRLALQVRRLESERDRLETANKDLRSSLERRKQRLQQMFGERSQLQARLKERDQEVERANRELGTLAAGAPWAVTSARQLWSALGSSLTRLWQGAAGRTSVRGPQEGRPPRTLAAPAAGDETEEPPLVARHRDRPGTPVVAAAVFGLRGEALAAVLDLIERYSTTHELTPLLLTDDDDLHALRARRMTFEYLPPADARLRFAPDLDWDIYVQRRLALIRRKWRPTRIIAFGPAAASVVQLWQASPFEDASLAKLIARRPDIE